MNKQPNKYRFKKYAQAQWPQMTPVQQGGQQDAVTADDMFEKMFGESAFATLRSKFPQLVKYVVTFRVLESDVHDGTGIGVFIVQNGKDIRYIPVIMADGAIASCELIYDKKSDNFSPLDNVTSNDIISSNMLGSASIMGKDVNVEDTQNLFRNMVRPPASSSVVMASNTSLISCLPDIAKQRVLDWLNNNHETLSKIAASYDISTLSKELSSRSIECCPHNTPVLSLKSLTKEAAANLTKQERVVLLRDGFLVKKTASSDKIVAPADSVESEVTAELGLEEVHATDTLHNNEEHANTVRAVRAVCVENGKLRIIPALMFGNTLRFADGRTLENFGSVIVQGVSDKVSAEYLISIGAVRTSGLQRVLSSFDSAALIKIAVFTPNKSGGYSLSNVPYVSSVCKHMQFQDINNTAALTDIKFGTSIIFSDDINNGAVVFGQSAVVPMESLLLLYTNDTYTKPLHLIKTFDEFAHWLFGKGTILSVVSDGISTGITDNRTKKTANFTDRSKSAEWLVANYGLSHNQVNTVLSNKHSTIFSKTAFVDQQIPQGSSAGIPIGMPQTSGLDQYNQGSPANQQGVQIAQPIQPDIYNTFNPEAIQEAANLQDPDIIDTGILASFAQEPNIKELLLDYLPNFINTIDKIGRCIILLCLKKKYLEEFYGRDKYAQLLGSCRKMLKLLGDIVNDLKKFTNMS